MSGAPSEAAKPLARGRALVTGGGSGAGAAIALALAAAGHEVVICGRRAEPLQQVSARAAGIRPVCCDVANEAAVTALFAAEGPFEIVIANAGASESAPFARTESAAIERMITANLMTTFLVFRAALPEMARQGYGRMIAIASTAGQKGYAYVAPYAAAKHAVVGLVRSLALEAAKSGVTVNAICPGFMETEMTARSVARISAQTGRSDADVRGALAALNPMNRLVAPEDVARAVLWLVGPGTDLVTGQCIALSGGET